MPQSAFSFHCMICFEEFHPDDRYPVVLPCGHTYVCNLCGDRLDKCMECRIPLVWTVPRPLAPGGGPSPAHANRVASYRATRPNQPASPPPPPVKKRLPLPKNVVLLSLIEATELATEDASGKHDLSPVKYAEQEGGGCVDLDTEDDGSVTAVVNAEYQEEERIKLGTTLALSVAGTYAVTARAGLPLFLSRPSSVPRNDGAFAREGSQQAASDEDVDALVRFFHLDQKGEGNSTHEDELKENRAKEVLPGLLSCGDRVQVVAIEGGWAKLARGYGFVQADDNKLVKVGGSVDRACKLEAMLRSLSTQRKQLRSEQSKVDNLFIRLMNDLQISLMTDEDLTVIVPDTFAKASGEAKAQMVLQDEVRDKEPSDGTNDISGPVKPQHGQEQESRQDGHAAPTVLTTAARGFACFANDVFDTISGTGSDDVDYIQQQQLSRQKQVRLPPTRTLTPSRGHGDHVSDVAALFPSATHPSPSAMSAGARAWRELHGRDESKEVDFKTGMSGHMALFSSSAHPHEYLGGQRSFTGYPKMSSHSGLNITKPLRKSVGDFYNSMYQSLYPYPSLNIPSLSGLSGTPERVQEADSRSDRSDSI